MSVLHGNTFWDKINKNQLSYPKLNSDITCDIVIIGSGITGCLTNYFLSLYNVKTILLEKNIIGDYSTLSCEGILDIGYDILPINMLDFLDKIKTIRALKLTEKSLDDLEIIVNSLHKYCGYQLKDKFHIIKTNSFLNNMNKTYNFLKENYIDCNLLDSKTINELFSFDGNSGISYKKSAIIDPFKLCHIILKYCRNKGSLIFENSPISSIHSKENELIIKSTDYKITCKKIILTSYETIKPFIKKNLFISYIKTGIVTEPVNNFDGWYNKCNIEIDENYKYMFRTTSDNRLFVTCTHNTPTISEKHLMNKTKELFPYINIPNLYTSWNIVDYTTFNGIPYIGELPNYKNIFVNISNKKNFVLGSFLGAVIIKDLILYNSSNDYHIFNLQDIKQ